MNRKIAAPAAAAVALGIGLTIAPALNGTSAESRSVRFAAQNPTAHTESRSIIAATGVVGGTFNVIGGGPLAKSNTYRHLDLFQAPTAAAEELSSAATLPAPNDEVQNPGENAGGMNGWVWRAPNGNVYGKCSPGYVANWNEVRSSADALWTVYNRESGQWLRNLQLNDALTLWDGTASTLVYQFHSNGTEEFTVGLKPLTNTVNWQEGDCQREDKPLPVTDEPYKGGGVPTPTPTPSATPTPSVTPTPIPSTTPTPTPKPTVKPTTPAKPVAKTKTITFRAQIDRDRLIGKAQADAYNRIGAAYTFRESVKWDAKTGRVYSAPLWVKGVETSKVVTLKVTVPANYTNAQIVAAEKVAASKVAGVTPNKLVVGKVGQTVTSAYLIPKGAWDNTTSWKQGPKTSAQVLAGSAVTR